MNKWLRMLIGWAFAMTLAFVSRLAFGDQWVELAVVVLIANDFQRGLREADDEAMEKK